MSMPSWYESRIERQIRKEAENLMQALASKSSEWSVRKTVTDLNERILQARQGLVDGPPVVLNTFDVDKVVEAWRRQRAQPGEGESATEISGRHPMPIRNRD
jgi:hypothetical protein